ncbi:MAG: hypothetical protein ATN33_02235 [Epulopiscium sp. Nele67-Bin001]|nr:MAG: hypothetical protein ATN33_02235 [Epulopiscium sp. Nele67-Bin001]
MKIKLLNTKLLILALIFVVAIMNMTVSSIDLIDYNTAAFVSDLQGTEVVVGLHENMELLQNTACALAEDRDIVRNLMEIESQGYSLKNIDNISNSIHNYYNVISNLDFVDSITVISLAGQFIIGDNYFIENYDVQHWFDDGVVDEQDGFFIEVFEHASNGEKTISASKVVINPDTNEPLGIVMVKMYLEELLFKLQNDYRIADVDIFLEFDRGVLYLVDNELVEADNTTIDFSSLYDKEAVQVLDYTIPGSSNRLVFVVDLNSLNQHEQVANNRQYFVNRIYILTLRIGAVILLALVLVARPIIKALSSMINVAQELGDDYTEYQVGIDKLVETAKFIEENLHKKIKHLVYYDETTGLANRKMLKTFYNKYMEKDEPFVVMLLDIKRFKRINDLYGEAIGNRVLIDITDRLLSSLRALSADFIRYNGDEFLIFCELNKIPTTIEECFEKQVNEAFFKPLLYSDTKPIQVDFNAVAIVCPTHVSDEDDMIKKLYILIGQKKSMNDSTPLVFSCDLYAKYTRAEVIKDCLRMAIHSGEFVVNYQPMIDHNKKICKAEALIRWNSNQLGFVSPGEFIYIAEKTRMIIDLGYWIIEKVASDLEVMITQGRAVQISINASPIQLMEHDFVNYTKRILDRHGIDYKYICIEITEGILLEERSIAKHNIKAFQDLGIAIALDDFGTGYSSFSYLKEYNLDVLKIDKIFIDNASEKDYAIIGIMSQVADILDMQIVLEGIETQEQFDKVSKYGLIQGYYFSKPLVWNDFNNLLMTN